MITETNLKDVLDRLGFAEFKSGDWRKSFPEHGLDCEMRVDFRSKTLTYPSLVTVNDKTTSNFEHDENFVVFECVVRLLDKGYSPEHLELEPRWQTTRGAATGGGKADIWIRTIDKQGIKQSLCIIECKTAGGEFEKAWHLMCADCDQLFSYGFEHRETQFLCLYASDFVNDSVIPQYHLVSIIDNDEYLKNLKHKKIPTYRDATNNKALFRAWKETYEQSYATKGLFEDDIQAYHIGKKKYTSADLAPVKSLSTIQRKYHEFATILRQHNVSGHENAFDKLVNLFLAKVVDETNNPQELLFYWKGVAYDDDFRLQDRLQSLYSIGMDKFLGEKVTYINEENVENAFKLFRRKPDETKETIRSIIHELKFFSNNDFAFIDVHNEHLFYQNAVILRKIVMMLEDMKLRDPEQEHQFLGDLFEGFLDQGVKQSEGQFFTPIPYVKFMVSSLPIAQMVADKADPPRVIDYACGAGHFLNEYASQVCRPVEVKNVGMPEKRKRTFAEYFSAITGIEKEYRLSKVTKVAAFMYGQDDIKVVYGDALSDLSAHGIKDGSYDVLVANPPYSVKGFFETLTDAERAHYSLSSEIDPKSMGKSNAIETFFIERAAQLLVPGGLAAIILPVSVLTKGGIYMAAREIMLSSFDIVAIAEMGSGTFGKTGTNTATFFLRRKDTRPDYATHARNRVDAWFGGDFSADSVFDDVDIIDRYAATIGVAPKDYRTLLCGKPNDALLAAEVFKNYRTAFSKDSMAKSIRKKRLTAKYTAADRDREVESHILATIVEAEKFKLRIFMIAISNPQDVVVVKSPTKTKEIQQFLGYKWSGRRGNEGIKYLGGDVVADDDDSSDETDDSSASSDTNWLERNRGISQIKTPLFNYSDLDDATKINMLIRRNFLGKKIDVPDSLEEFVNVLPLEGMIDFTQSNFDLSLQTGGIASLNVSYDGGRVPLASVCDYVHDRIDFSAIDARSYITTDNMLPTKGGVSPYNGNPIGGTVVRYQPNDILVSNIRPYLKKIWLADTHGGCSPDVLVFRVKNEKEVNPYYLYQLLSADEFFDFVMMGKKGAKMPRGNKNMIPRYPIFVPDMPKQKKIVKECQKVDAEYAKVRMSIDEYKSKIRAVFERLDAIRGGVSGDLGQYLLPINGANVKVPLDQIHKVGKVPVVTQEKGSIIAGYADIEDEISDIPVIVFGDHSCSFKYIDFPFVRGADGTQLLKFDPHQFDVKFMFYYLQMQTIENQDRYERHMKYLKQMHIKVPLLGDQKKAVAELEKYEVEIAKAESLLPTFEERKRVLILRCLNE